MLYPALILYGLLALLLLMFRRAMRGRSFAEMMARSEGEHHRVLRVIKRHPQGGSWREYRRWMEGEEDLPD